ncbi:MAG TPA: SufD family Fe-S cluster assembly protein [Acidimicrobiales bacterium]|nr:SufD family Fe-S cluster assembly protein [Acidimicrobiales bacterium]
MRERLCTLSTFSPETASALEGPPWLRRRRTAAAEAFASAPLPTEKDEVWRYSRIDDIDLARFQSPEAFVDTSTDTPVPMSMDRILALVDGLGPRSGLIVTVNGVLASVSQPDDDRLTVGRITAHPEAEALLGSIATDPADFVLLSDAFAPDPVAVDIAPGATIEDPVVVVHVVSGSGGDAVFPRSMIRGSASSVASVIEIAVDADTGGGLLAELAPTGTPSGASRSEHLVVPVTELQVADGAKLSFVSIQALGPATWQLAHQASTIGADASLHSFAVALGGAYARLRTDSALIGASGSSKLRAAYIGRDDQMLDFRTLQDHRAPKTTSDLLFMGAVADHSHSVYSGLIRMRRGAVRSDAMQTNHNLVLDEGAHADSVPNLDIEENDVRCSHASTVGPVSEDQLYYLESRGVEPEVAERLIVAGFFDDIANQVPIAGTRATIGRALADRTGVHGA